MASPNERHQLLSRTHRPSARRRSVLTWQQIRRWSVLLADPDPATIGARAAAAFADHAPAWPTSVYQSADVQIAAPSAAAVNAGDYLCVVGDFHPGANPLGQGVFATRHPDRDQFLGAIASDVGTLPFMIPPRDAGFHTTRNMLAITRPGDVHVAAGARDRMPDGYRTLPAADLITDGETVTTPDGSWQAPLTHLLWLPMLIAAVHAYDPLARPTGTARGSPSAGRSGGGRPGTSPPAQGPALPQAAASWARDLGLPRRVFVLFPGELKPIYVDFDSPVLTRILCRQLRRAAPASPACRCGSPRCSPGLTTAGWPTKTAGATPASCAWSLSTWDAQHPEEQSITADTAATGHLT